MSGAVLAAHAPGYNLSVLQGAPKIVLDVLVCNVVANFLLHGQLPPEHFFIGQAEH